MGEYQSDPAWKGKEVPMRKVLAMQLLVLIVVIVFSPWIAGAEENWHSVLVLNQYPHDPAAFTQGLVYCDGFLYEGTGLYGHSSLRKVRLEDGALLESVPLEKEYFGEGIAILGDRIIQLTWRERQGFVYDRASLERIAQFSYETEGWGLTTDGQYLIMSDGSSVLIYLEPESYQPIRRLTVHGPDGPIGYLNELEYIRGAIYANIWLTPNIVRIDPETGQVTDWIDLSELNDLERGQDPGVDVPNGIAYDPEGHRLFVTGKLWRNVYQIAFDGF